MNTISIMKVAIQHPVAQMGMVWELMSIMCHIILSCLCMAADSMAHKVLIMKDMGKWAADHSEYMVASAQDA
jgi:hypothetical protein